MNWNNTILQDFRWTTKISNEEAKKAIASKIAEFVSDGDVIGVGSGSTAYLTLFAIAEKVRSRGINISALPTSREISLTCTQLGIPVTSLFVSRPDWYFDGADEVDPQKNLIKGRGGALYQEKLILSSSPKNYILVDDSKFVDTLGKKFPVPVEIFPESLHRVEDALRILGADTLQLRMAGGKDGPIITENGGLILDVHFPHISDGLEHQIKKITGVIESGLFQGYDVEIISL